MIVWGRARDFFSDVIVMGCHRAIRLRIIRRWFLGEILDMLRRRGEHRAADFIVRKYGKRERRG